jgi:hypothetical protein
MGVFVISPLPPFLIKTSCAARSLRSTGITPLLRYYGPGRRRLIFHRFPGFAGYTIYLAPPLSPWDEDGFTSCSACPCHRAAPTTPPKCHDASVSLRHAMLPSPDHRGLGLQIISCRGHLRVHSRYGPVTRSPSKGWPCQLASSASFPPRMQPKLRGPDFSPGGTVSHGTCQPFAGRTMARKMDLLETAARLLSWSLRLRIID